MAVVTSDTPEPARARRKGIYLLPNLLTTGCLFSGFYAVVAAIDMHFAPAGMAVFLAMIFDGLDGRIARWTHTESAFGKEYDSLADMVAFGLAPAIVAYQWGAARGALQRRGRDRGQALLRGPAEPFGGRDRGGLRVVLQRVARAGTHRPDRRLRRDRDRGRADGEPLRLSELQAFRSRPAH